MDLHPVEQKTKAEKISEVKVQGMRHVSYVKAGSTQGRLKDTIYAVLVVINDRLIFNTNSSRMIFRFITLDMSALTLTHS